MDTCVVNFSLCRQPSRNGFWNTVKFLLHHLTCELGRDRPQLVKECHRNPGTQLLALPLLPPSISWTCAQLMDIASSAAPQLTYRIAQNPQNPSSCLWISQSLWTPWMYKQRNERTNKSSRADSLNPSRSFHQWDSVIVQVKAGRKLRSRLRTEDKGPSPEEDLDEVQVNEEEMLKESEETSGVEAHVELWTIKLFLLTTQAVYAAVAAAAAADSLSCMS